MEISANKNRQPQEFYKKGDLVWLNLKNIQTPQLSKKLAWINAKYRITKVVSPHEVQLAVPSGIWPNFHVELLKRDPQNPLPSQISNDTQPPPLINSDGIEEQIVEKILRPENRRVGRGFRRSLVKWKQFEEPNWEPGDNLEDTEALDIFESKYGTGDNVGEEKGPRTGAKKKNKNKLN